MLLLKLFAIFSYISLFNFGGGYAMISFIQQEIVERQHWMGQQEFTDIVAVSQMTPGPIGINCATYVGYTAVTSDPQIRSWCGVVDQYLPEPISHGASLHLMGILGSVLATIAIIWLPFIVMIMVSRLILRHHDSIMTRSIFDVLRPAIIGLLASASLSLMTADNFGRADWQAISGGDYASLWPLLLSIAIFVTVVYGMQRHRWNIIYTIIGCAVIGAVAYGVMGL